MYQQVEKKEPIATHGFNTQQQSTTPHAGYFHHHQRSSSSPSYYFTPSSEHCQRIIMMFGIGSVVMWAMLSSFVGASTECTEPCVPGSNDIMKPKEHGTCPSTVQKSLKWNVDWDVADRICCNNRRYAEYSGYWQTTEFPNAVQALVGDDTPLTFYDPVTGLPLFTAPQDRAWDDFLTESKRHGWPSFRDSEVHWENVRVLPDGETVSVNGTHLGHNLPDGSGNRFCISEFLKLFEERRKARKYRLFHSEKSDGAVAKAFELVFACFV
jgi:hypothetical protein